MADRTKLSDAQDAEVRAAMSRILTASMEREKRRIKKSALCFAISAVATALFVEGMPLHYLFHPWGQILVIVFALCFASAFFNVSVFASEWLGYWDLKRGGRRAK